ncbi:MATE family efflux transporter [Sporomusa acidovorans]|uniref:Probable multidrug resistance protein NorM n=1 Tax=Sporomusa acidovorans (strain ATCC 49682 / DSM 3132 / Mol) TaxID=1123286 RepID=A0ABZ3J8V3_SPOA4|nr:MATE family efflux transporter [Sporomusa acidovorans]OZC16214.1 multidrug resistance protein NorM [Sporomusa acidovorans DSM 3132]SDE31576.1 multidrug resistance protein, MATE family [Sporomusa acidovorans]
MKQTYTLQEKIRQLVIILLPIFITQLSLCSLSFFDAMMSGHASQHDLAGVAIGSNLWMPVFSGINGILMALTPIIAQLNGAGRHKEMPFIVLQGCYLAVVLAGIVILAGIVLAGPVLSLMGLEPVVADIAYRFLAAIALGVVPLFLSTALRSFIDTLGYTRITMLIMLGALPVNVLLNYLLVFGHLGFPRLGGVGTGYASALTYWLILVFSALTIVRMPQFRGYAIFNKWYAVSLATWQELLRIGVPIGFAIFCETSIFGVVAILMARFGTVTIAAHQAAINFASLVYMLPLSISMALTIVVGFEVGAKRFRDARQYTRMGVGFAVFAAIFCALGLLVFNQEVASLYTNDADVLVLTQHFLLYAAFFQLSDAVAAPVQGVLRGYKDVKVTFIMALLSYWVIGLPVGYMLSYHQTFGPFGYWIGFIVGLAVGATVLLLRLISVQRKSQI